LRLEPGLDFLAPPNLAGIDEQHDLLRFVRRYGLLHCGPEAAEHRESLEDWRIAVGWLTGTLTLCLDLAAFVDGDASRYEAIRGSELVRIHARGEPPVIREELERLASGAVAHAVTAGLGDVTRRVVADIESDDSDAEPGLFRYFFEPRNLLGHALAEVAHLIVQRAPLARCPECGRFFAVEHGRQKYCTPACASRARYKRFAAKRRMKLEEEQ
jgi:hypothetical protein